MKEFLNEIVNDADKRSQYVNTSTDFTRKRGLPLSDLILLLINLLKRSLSIELQDFFTHIGNIPVTKSAFCQQRKKLKAEFFQDWNNVLISGFYQYADAKVKKWRGFVLLAIDGTTLSLPNTALLRETYGYSTNGHKTQSATARASVLYDVLNKVIIKSRLCVLKESERTTACDLIEDTGSNNLLLFDRGYPSFMLFYLLLNKQQSQFVMRAKVNFNEETNDFMNSNKKDTTIWLSATYKAIRGLEKKGIHIDSSTKVKVRMVKVRLKSGEEELLITNLYDKEKYSLSDLKELYFLRWPIEVCYGYIKNELQLESFSGINPICIEQDFYANILVYNIQSLIEMQSDEYIEVVSRKRKVNYKINKNISWAMLKGRIVDLFLIENDSSTVLLELRTLFERHLEPVRPGRKFPRTKKSIKLLGKYTTLTNYKRAI